jgi:Uma2 family endonuclease
VTTARKQATYDDLLAVPDHLVAELVNGVLHTSPRPALRHAQATVAISDELAGPFKRGRGGPGGWIILFEPELHLGRNVVVPDLAGWTRERMPELPDATYVSVAPDWVCEVLSPSTAALDRAEKLPLYGAHGVAHAWLVDPDTRTLEVHRLDGRTLRLIATHRDAEHVRAEPFDAFELDLALLWQR